MAVPPLGCGNGGLRWSEVRLLIEEYVGDLEGVEVQLYEPTARYQNVVKRHGVEKLTPARALVAELIRRYSALGIECSLLEVQKLAYFLSRSLRALGLDDPLRLDFTANRYGPYADPLRHLLDALDGSYLHCDRRISDATPSDAIHFDHSRKPLVKAYLQIEAAAYLPAIRRTSEVVEGFESPLGMELLATVDWLLTHEHREPTLQALREGVDSWHDNAGDRKQRLFDDRMLGLALKRLTDPACSA